MSRPKSTIASDSIALARDSSKEKVTICSNKSLLALLLLVNKHLAACTAIVCHSLMPGLIFFDCFVSHFLGIKSEQTLHYEEISKC